jgi:hypothetical protein
MDYWKSYENIKIKLNSWSSQVVRSNVELKLICKGEKEPTPTPPGWTSTCKEGAKGRGLQYMDSFNTCLLNN